MTHGHGQQGGEWLWEWDGVGTVGQRGKMWDNCDKINTNKKRK